MTKTTHAYLPVGILASQRVRVTVDAGTAVKPGFIVQNQLNLDYFVKVFTFVFCAGFVLAMCR
jgi:hypothetical protein